MKIEKLNNAYIKGKVLGIEFTNEVYASHNQSFSDVVHDLKWGYFENNYSCDCNKKIFIGLNKEGVYECGETIPYEKLELHWDNFVIDLLDDAREWSDLYG